MEDTSSWVITEITRKIIGTICLVIGAPMFIYRSILFYFTKDGNHALFMFIGLSLIAIGYVIYPGEWAKAVVDWVGLEVDDEGNIL